MVASVVAAARTPSDGTDAQSSSIAATIPAGTAVDDYAVISLDLWLNSGGNPTVTYPSGFTEIVNYVSTTDGFQKLKVAIKKLTAADSGTYSCSWSGSYFRQAHVTIIRGVDLTTALDVAVNLAQNSTGTGLPSNSLTTANAGCLLMRVISNENASTGLPDTGYTEQADSNYLKTNTKVAGSAGTETPAGGSFSVSTLKLGALIAFRAAGGGGSSLTVSPADTLGLTDAVQLAKGLAPADSEGLTDSVALSKTLGPADALGLTDAAVFTVGKVVADTLGLTDSVQVVLGTLAQFPADTLGLTDSIALDVGKTVADSEGLTDAITLAKGLAPADVLGLTDAAVVVVTRSLSPADVMGLSDQVLTVMVAQRSYVDTLGLTDSVQVVLSGLTVDVLLAGFVEPDRLAGQVVSQWQSWIEPDRLEGEVQHDRG